jgi:hypothetical protein
MDTSVRVICGIARKGERPRPRRGIGHAGPIGASRIWPDHGECSDRNNYQLVLDQISTLVERVIWSTHSKVASNPTENSKDGKGEARPIYGQETAPPPLHSTPSSILPSLSPDLGVKPGSSELNLSKEAVQESASKSTLTVDSLDSSFHQPQGDEPSPYLRKLCVTGLSQ